MIKKAEVELIDTLNKENQIQKDYLHLLELDYVDIKNDIPLNELNTLIIKYNKIINTFLDDNEKKLKNKEIKKINSNLHNTNINVIGLRKYYNNAVNKYNTLCVKFPSNVVSKICHFHKIDLLEEEISEQFKILSK